MSSGVGLFAIPCMDRASLVAGLAEVGLRSLEHYTFGLAPGTLFAGLLDDQCREELNETN
jgi:hypothetical protein